MTMINTPEERTAFIQYTQLMSDVEIADALEDARKQSDADATALLQEELTHRQSTIEGNSC